MFHAQQSAEPGGFGPHGSGVMDRRKLLWNLPLCLRKAVEVRHVSGVPEWRPTEIIS